MPVNPTYPGLYIEELPSSVHTIVAAPTSITVFVGYVHPFQGDNATARNGQGNWGTPVRIFNFADYERNFGGVYRNQSIGRSDVAYAVSQFFLNGGSDAWVVPLQPKYYQGSTGTPITPASDSLSGIRFEARELTDDDHKLTVTIRKRDAADRADIVISYGRQLESYPSVLIRSGPPANYTTAGTPTYEKDFIDNRLKDSRLVKVKPEGTSTQYPATYTITGQQESRVLAAMTAPTPAPTLFLAQDFVDVFRAEGLLDKVDIFNLLVIPGVTDLSVSGEALNFCERKRAFFIMDAPERATPVEIETIMASDVIPKTPPNGALYYPYLKAPDAILGGDFALPPSGFVAGVYARTDANRGVWKAPAGLETSISTTSGVVEQGRMTDIRQGLLNPLGINVLRSFLGTGTVVWGARTISTKIHEQWRYVPVRRMALFIEQTLLRNLGWVVFEPNDEPLWAAIRISIESFMLSLFHQGAFQGRTPSEAFRVRCDKFTTPQVEIDKGIVNIEVGFRPLKPAEFVIIKISQLAGQAQV